VLMKEIRLLDDTLTSPMLLDNANISVFTISILSRVR
jgi:hypothetical protein